MKRFGCKPLFAGDIIRLGQHSLFLTMRVCLALGMGIPTIANDIITSSLAALPHWVPAAAVTTLRPCP